MTGLTSKAMTTSWLLVKGLKLYVTLNVILG